MTCHSDKYKNGGEKMNIETVTVEQFRTSDRQTFADRTEAIRHQVGVDIASDLERYRTTCMDGSSDRFKHSVCRHIAEFERMRATTEEANKEATS